MLKRKSKIILLIAISVAFTLFTYKSIFFGRLLGDPFDSRLHIILHEHWWRWLNGLVSFRDTEFFYPFDRALGYSDVFLIQGIVYSFFRFVGFSLSSSWSITTIGLLLIGNIGWVFIARKFVKSYFLQILMVMTFVSSLSFVYYFTLNPNIMGYAYLSWFTLLIVSISQEKNVLVKNRKISIFITLFLVYALSCWYAAFFVLLILITRIFLESIFGSKKINSNKSQYKYNKIIKQYYLQAPPQLFLIWLFVYVYVLVANDPSRSVEQLLENSPRVKYLANGSNVDGTKLSGAFFKQIYLNLGLDFEKELGIGLGIFSILFGIIVAFYGFYKKIYNLGTFLWILTFVLIYLYFHVWWDRFSFHRLLFELIPGFNSIRYPARFIIIIGFCVIFLIFFSLDRLLKDSSLKKGTFAALIGLIILVDQSRTSFKGWDSDILINSELMSQKQEILNSCDYFYYNFPGGWWYEQIEAMTFAIQIGVPTVNGYSGAFPPDYPTQNFSSESNPTEIFKWISEIKSDKRGCFVTGRSDIKPLSSDFNVIDFVGFTSLEEKGNNSWRWAVSSSPYIYVVSNTFQRKKIEFSLDTSECFPNQIISIYDENNNKLFPDMKIEGETTYRITLDMADKAVKRIQFNTDANKCKLEGDPRNLYFEIKNFTIS